MELIGDPVGNSITWKKGGLSDKKWEVALGSGITDVEETAVTLPPKSRDPGSLH
jgi:hypothetical protein